MSTAPSVVMRIALRNASDAIRRVNKRRRSGGSYLDDEDLAEVIDEVLPSTLRQASLEAFEGRHDEAELAALLKTDELKQNALSIISA
jgi:DNA-directed RNA polymerase specialized sigma24 family protein